jgi:hypothetical protein
MAIGSAQAADFSVADEVMAPPRSPFVGEVGAYLGLGLHVDEDGDSEHAFLFGGNARLGWWANHWLYLQGDLQGEATTVFPDVDEHRSNADAALHLAYRSQTHLLGIFGGWAYTRQIDNSGAVMTRYYLGGEGQAYWGNFTFYAQGGYSWLGRADDDHDEPVNGAFVRGVIRYFHTPNDKIEGDLAYFRAPNTIGHTDGGPVQEIDWSILYEHQFANSPLALNVRYAGVRYTDESNDADGNPNFEHMFTIGAKYRFHSPGTLREADMMGTSLDTPMFRGMSWLSLAH